MKRLLALLTACCLLAVFLPGIAVASTEESADIYTEYLISGGYKEIMAEGFSKSNTEIKTCLVELDDDGTLELLISLTDISSPGASGYPVHTALLDIENGNVVIRVAASNWGGTDGGRQLILKYDSGQERHVLVCEDISRDSRYAFGNNFMIYSSQSYKVDLTLESYSCVLDYMGVPEMIRAETDLYEQDGEGRRKAQEV